MDFDITKALSTIPGILWRGFKDGVVTALGYTLDFLRPFRYPMAFFGVTIGAYAYSQSEDYKLIKE